VRISGLSTGGVRASVVSLLYPSADLISLDPKAETPFLFTGTGHFNVFGFSNRVVKSSQVKSCKDLRLTRLHVPSRLDYNILRVIRSRTPSCLLMILSKDKTRSTPQRLR